MHSAVGRINSKSSATEHPPPPGPALRFLLREWRLSGRLGAFGTLSGRIPAPGRAVLSRVPGVSASSSVCPLLLQLTRRRRLLASSPVEVASWTSTRDTTRAPSKSHTCCAQRGQYLPPSCSRAARATSPGSVGNDIYTHRLDCSADRTLLIFSDNRISLSLNTLLHQHRSSAPSRAPPVAGRGFSPLPPQSEESSHCPVTQGSDSGPSRERGEDEIRVDEHEGDSDEREGGERAFEQ
jgi:hypothetical protein